MKNHKPAKPPRLAKKLFECYCGNAAVEDLHGDMEELFLLNIERMSVRRARLEYWRHTLALMFSYTLKSRKQKVSYHTFSSNILNPAMFKNYFLIATRSLARHKFFTIINVLGLAVGMSIGLLLIAMLSFLWRYDTFHTNKENIYRVVSLTNTLNDTDEFASAPSPVAGILKEFGAGINEVVRISATLEGTASYGKHEVPLHGYFVDPSFLKVFSFPLLKGNINTALEKPNSVLITEKASKKMFGSEDAFGKVIIMGDSMQYEITGVLKDLPKNSHMRFEIIGSYATLLQQQTLWKDPSKDWLEFRDSYVYLLLSHLTSTKTIENYINAMAKPMFSAEEDYKASFSLQALNEIVPGPDLSNQLGPSWDYPSISIFLFLTLLILIPACFNYANISISRALKRMKEIGLRKVMGGQNDQIFLQFILETVIITTIALCISYFIFTLIRQEFINMLVGGQEGIELSPDFRTVIYFIVFALFVGFVAGMIPALYFSKLSPIQALKGKLSGGKTKKLNFRKSLIVVQFALSLGFIMSVVIVFNQYRETLQFDFGFDQENILDVELQGVDPEIFRNEFSKLAAVNSLSMSSHIMGTESYESTWVLSEGQTDSVEVFQMFVDDHYLENLKLELLAGRNFDDNPSANSKYAIVNEEFLKQLSITNPSDALDRSFLLADEHEIIVIGVVKNFHYLNLREPIRSFFFRYDPNHFGVANLKVNSTDIFNTISTMESVWKRIEGEKKFESKFFDDEIEDAYSFYFSMIKICGFLGLLAITISCLGLLGMVVFTVENRVKEIGIRKVMGASTGTITLLLSRDFAKLMVIAAMIATPLTYLFFDKIYLRVQYYKIPIGVSEIIISVASLFALGLVTIMSQTTKAAQANPVDTLRNE